MKPFVVNELTLPVLLLCRLLRRPAIMLAVDALLPPLNGILRRACRRLRDGDAVRMVWELLPQRHPEWDHAGPLLDNMYETLEPQIERIFRFDRLAALPVPYAIAARHAATTYVSGRLGILLSLRQCGEAGLERPADACGLADGIRRLAIADADGAEAGSVWRSAVRRVTNAAVAVGSLFYAVAWTLMHLRLRRQEPETVDVAFDYIFDTSDDGLCREISRHRRAMLVGRSGTPSVDRLPDDMRRYARAGTDDGRVAPVQAPGYLGRTLADTIGIWRAAGGTDTALFLSMISLPLKNMRYRAFFDRYRIGMFWGRDQYNPEHVLRHHQLRRIGGRSWGVLQGCPSYAALYPQFRYLSFDRYYMLTPSLFGTPERRHWPDSMKVVGVEAFCATRDEYERRFAARPSDIAFMSSIWTGKPEFTEAVGTVARAFPDRKIYVQSKPGFAATPAGLRFAEAAVAIAPNVEVSKELPYDLFIRTRFVVSDPSTVALEAIQFGNYAFMFDIPSDHEIAFHRTVDGYCVGSGEEIVERIRGIEAMTWRYPIENFDNLLRLDGEHFVDTVLRDLGLPAAMAPRPIWRNGESLLAGPPPSLQRTSSA